MEYQRTIATAVSCSGVGLHTGAKVTVKVRPAPVGHGIVFVRTDLPGRQKVRAAANNVGNTSFATALLGRGFVISTVEHLMSALHGHSVDNATIEINGEELPIMDGSAAAYSVLLKSAGLKEQSEPRRYLQVIRPVKVSEGDKWATLLPGDHFSVTYEIAYQHQAIRNQRFDLVVTPENYDAELAPARTFGFLADLEMMRQAGLAGGGSLDNAIVVGNYSVLNAGGLRYPDEFVRHKAMDAVGDLYLAGFPILGRFHAYKSGHGLNHKLVTALLEDRKAWRVVIDRPVQEFDSVPMAAAYAT